MKKSFRKQTLKTLLASVLALSALPAVAQQGDTSSVQRRTLKEVSINTGRASQQTPITTSNMNQRQISDNKTDISIPYILNTLPSVVAEGENGMVGNTSMRVRGIDRTRINVNINGITLNDAESQMVYWVNLPNLAGMAQNIQLQRGITASTEGSSDFGGAINLQTLNGKFQPYAVADLSGGSFNTRQYNFMVGSGITKHNWSFDFAYNGMNTDGYVRNGFADHKSFFASATHYGERSIFKAIAIVGKQKTGITWNGAYAEDLDNDPTYNDAGAYDDAFGNIYYYGNETDNYFQRHYQLYYNYALTSRWNINAVADITYGDGYYENYKNDKKPGSKYNLNTDSTTLNKSDFITRKMMDNVAYTANIGANYHSDKFQLSFGQAAQLYDGLHFGNIIWAQDPSLYTLNTFNDEGELEWYRNHSVKTSATSYLRANWDISHQSNLYADLQFRMVHYTMDGIDDDDIFDSLKFDENYNFFNPKVGYNRLWTSNNNQQNRLYFVAGISHREPCRADIKDAYYSNLWYQNGDTVKAEAMLDIEAGYQIRRSRFAASANLYAMLYKDQLTPSGRINSASGYALMDNVDRSYRLGIELEAGYWATDWMHLAGNLTLSRNKIIDYVYTVSVMDENWDYDHTEQRALGTTDLSFSPSVVGAAIATFKPFYACGEKGRNFNIQFVGKYVGEMYVDNTSREEMLQEDYFLLNLKAGYTWQLSGNKQIEAQIVVNNLLDHTYRVNAWNASYYFTDSANDSYDRAYFQQPGRNVMARLVFSF